MEGSGPTNTPARKKKLPDRFLKASFPPAAVLGAFSSFFTSALQHRPDLRMNSSQDSLVQISFSARPSIPVPARMEIEYSQAFVLGGAPSAHPFRRSLSGIAIDASDNMFVLSDGEVKIFDRNGAIRRSWRAPEDSLCLTVSPGGRVYFGLAGRVDIYGTNGNRLGGFPAGDVRRPARVTAIKTFGRETLVADADARYIRRYDQDGKQLGVVGTQGKIRSFMLPNRWLDMDIDSKGVIRATDSGRHRVTAWMLDGAPLGYFGKFGQINPEDFAGCCNPVNLAIAPDGNIITAEKAVARVKVYSPGGKLLALIGPEHFDPQCTHLYLAADSKGRVLVADPVRLEVKVFDARSLSE